MFHVTPETRARLIARMEIRDRTTQEIEDDIRVARSEGGSLREIGLIVGMSHTEIRRIINKEMGAAS